MTFRVGQKVEKFERGDDPPPSLVPVGSILTVADIRASLRWPGECVLKLYGVETWQRAIRYRPIVERKTDISIFTAMLNPSRKKEKA